MRPFPPSGLGGDLRGAGADWPLAGLLRFRFLCLYPAPAPTASFGYFRYDSAVFLSSV